MNNYRLPFLATVVLLSLASWVSGPDHMPPTTDLPAKFRESAIEEAENALSSVHRDTQTVQARRAQVKSTQESLALSIGSYKDGQSSLLDMLDAQRSFATSQASLTQAVQQMAKDYVALNVAIGSGYNFDGPRSGQLLMNTEPHAVAAMDKRWIISDSPSFGRVS